MRRALALAVFGFGILALAAVVAPWLIYRDVQWWRRRGWMGHYEMPVEPGEGADRP